MTKLRAIDLYSGVGGWSLGLRLANIEVIASYEIWEAANTTNHRNNGHAAHTVDIRALALAALPKDIDVIVGSPPCTTFSLSNRGGGGDIEDGFRDIAKFLEIVDYLKPSFWVMENVPRVVKLFQEEIQTGGRLARFSHIPMKSAIVNCAEFGLPQRRRRCLIGNIDFDLLNEYRWSSKAPTLGEVVQSLSSMEAVDPIYDLRLPRTYLTDHTQEEPLNEEEEQINKYLKTRHLIYNSMPFPDVLGVPSRTVTATCSRVSRESIIIENERDEPWHPSFRSSDFLALSGPLVVVQRMR